MHVCITIKKFKQFLLNRITAVILLKFFQALRGRFMFSKRQIGSFGFAAPYLETPYQIRKIGKYDSCGRAIWIMASLLLSYTNQYHVLSAYVTERAKAFQFISIYESCKIIKYLKEKLRNTNTLLLQTCNLCAVRSSSIVIYLCSMIFIYQHIISLGYFAVFSQREGYAKFLLKASPVVWDSLICDQY